MSVSDPSKGKRGSSAFMLVLALGAAGRAGAADADAGPATAGDDIGQTQVMEVVVTARKRGEERLQDIPTAITRFRRADAARKWASRNSRTSPTRCPASPFNDTGQGEKRYILRGVQSAGQEQVAVYFDEVPAPGIQSSSGDSGSQTTDLELVDLERIEVLKGPQGTTFGANSQTGVVRFIANKPHARRRSRAIVHAGAESLKDGDPGATVRARSICP